MGGYSDKTYTKKALIPLWTAHITFILIFIGALAFLMMDISGSFGYVPAVYSAFMTFFCIALIVEPLEMVLQSYRILYPWLYLVFQVYKTLFSTVFSIYLIIVYAKSGDDLDLVRILVLVVLIVSILMMLSFWVSLIYSVVVLREHRRGGVYKHVRANRRDEESGGSRELKP